MHTEAEASAKVRKKPHPEGLPAVTRLPWLAICEYHHDSTRAKNERDGQYAIEHPWLWCIGCEGEE